MAGKAHFQKGGPGFGQNKFSYARRDTQISRLFLLSSSVIAHSPLPRTGKRLKSDVFPRTDATSLHPTRPIVISRSERMTLTCSATPSSPARASPYMNGRPTTKVRQSYTLLSYKMMETRTQDPLRTQRECFKDIGSVPDARVEEHRQLSLCLCFKDLGG